MALSKPGKASRTRKPVMPDFHDNRINKESQQTPDADYRRKHFGDRPISYLMGNATKTVDTPHGPHLVGSTLSWQCPLMVKDSCLSTQDNITCGDLSTPKEPYFQIPLGIEERKSEWAQLDLSFEEAEKLESSTQDQASCHLWHSERRRRITASNFGTIIKRKSPVTEIFLKNILCPGKFSCAATSYGVTNEKVARQAYSFKTGNHVHNCGLCVNPKFPFLGASPDGKVCSSDGVGLLEIKCPFSIRDFSISQALSTPPPGFCLNYVDGKVALKRDHIYYFQIQGQLLVTCFKFCDFVCYTKKDIFIERIYADDALFFNMLQMLSKFYLKHVKNFLSE